MRLLALACISIVAFALLTPQMANAQGMSQTCRVLQKFNQPESGDSSGRISVEAAVIHIVDCSGQQFYIYQYVNRPGFRAIRPPDWSHAIGGRDYPTFAEALAAAAAATGGAGGGAARGTAIKWSDYPLTAQRGYDKSGQRSTYTCPPNGTPSSVTGTDVYTDDSSICTAAVHAGLITFASGGTVTVEVRRPGPNRYTGSSRNGVTTRGYDNGPNPTLGAFVFVR